MQIKVQHVVCAEDGRAEQVQAVAMVEKPPQQIEPLGFTLAEAKSILKTPQQHLGERQATAFVAAHAPCDHCGKSLGIKEYHSSVESILSACLAPSHHV
jgi:alkyl sulfatase BDS1-like metallo-beta-lactamase superfamily hydrolase